NAAASEANAAASAASVDPQNLATDYAGPTEPAIMWSYMIWNDTGNMLRKMRNAANTAWVVIGILFGTGKLIGQRVYTASTVYIETPGTQWVIVEGVGSGGAAGGLPAGTGSGGAPGGSSGAYGIK